MSLEVQIAHLCLCEFNMRLQVQYIQLYGCWGLYVIFWENAHSILDYVEFLSVAMVTVYQRMD